MIHGSRELGRWSRGLGAMARVSRLAGITRVIVVPDVASTQDVARQHAAGEPGLLVIAGRQSAGRGRLGRVWTDEAGQGVAATFAIAVEGLSAERLSIAAGIAVCTACEEMIRRAGAVGRVRVGLRWPNDVVEITPSSEPGRKVAGVLIERADRLYMLGIGINVLQHASDWPAELRTRAVSLHGLGAPSTRLAVIRALWKALARSLTQDDSELNRQWHVRNVLNGMICTFEHNTRSYTGRVIAVQPTNEIELLTDAGVVRLPALSTSLVHEAGMRR